MKNPYQFRYMYNRCCYCIHVITNYSEMFKQRVLFFSQELNGNDIHVIIYHRLYQYYCALYTVLCFIIHVPYILVNIDQSEMKPVLVNTYYLAGKTYQH